MMEYSARHMVSSPCDLVSSLRYKSGQETSVVPDRWDGAQTTVSCIIIIIVLCHHHFAGKVCWIRGFSYPDKRIPLSFSRDRRNSVDFSLFLFQKVIG